MTRGTIPVLGVRNEACDTKSSVRGKGPASFRGLLCREEREKVERGRSKVSEDSVCMEDPEVSKHFSVVREP